MTIAIGYLGPRMPDRQAAQDRKRRIAPAGFEAAGPAPPQEQVAVSWPREEQYRADIAALNLALQASETAVALTEKALQGLTGADRCLGTIYLTAKRALDDFARGETTHYQKEIDALLHRLDLIGAQTRFGEQHLLDGGLGPKGDASGEGLTFVSAAPQARSSPTEGYAVVVRSPPLRALLTGEAPLTAELLRTPMRLRVQCGTRYAELRTRGGETFAQIRGALEQALRASELELRVLDSPERRLVIEHLRYGPGHSFWAESHPVGILSRRDGKPSLARDGRHIVGTLNGEPADGRGELLIGQAGNKMTGGLCVAFTGPVPDWLTALAWRGDESKALTISEGIGVGRAMLVQRGLTFRFKPADVEGAHLRLPSVRPEHLARRVENSSGFSQLREIRLESAQQARDTVALVEDALREVHDARAAADKLYREHLLPRLGELRVQAENLNAGLAAAIPNSEWAGRLAEYVSARFWDDQTLARAAHPNPKPGAVMKLIN